MSTPVGDDHFYGEDRAMVDEMECPICGWPYKPANADCDHEEG